MVRQFRWEGAMKRWFGPKMMGIGFSPYSWEGWASTLLCIAGIVGAAKFVPAPTLKFALMGALLALYLVIVALTYRTED
jgi:hypothetical protein